MDYHAFIDAMRRESFPIPVKFGICADYFTQHEILLSQMKAAYSYDCFVGCIRFIDNIAYSWDPHSKEMLWDKYNAAFLYRRYYEMMYALITSRLFDGVSGFDNIHHMQMNRTETVKTAEIQIRQHRKTAIETARIPAKT